MTRKRFGWQEGALVCLHAGNMGHKQGLENIAECGRLAQEQGISDLHFVLMGDGNQRAYLEELTAKYALLNLEFLPLQPEDDFSNVLAAADILLLYQRAEVSEMALPSKLTSYVATGRPVFAAIERDSEPARELASLRQGILVEPDRPDALLEALKRFASSPDWQSTVTLSPCNDGMLSRLRRPLNGSKSLRSPYYWRLICREMMRSEL